MRFLLALATTYLLLWIADASEAQTPRRPHVYDRLDAGAEAYHLQEQRRRYALGRQVWLNDQMIFWARSFPAWTYYAEPWPFLPGDIYGYPLAEPPINQPVGQVEEQLGPNTWFSRPVYADPIGPMFLEEVTEPVVAEDIVSRKTQGRSTGPREF